jgi:hypothetical protein
MAQEEVERVVVLSSPLAVVGNEGGKLQPEGKESEMVGLELARIKGFCANIIQTLAPPLLKEIDKTTKLRAEAEAFTPRRVTRSGAIAKGTPGGTQVKKASAAESTLLRALGIVPEDLSVSEEDLASFRRLFDVPISESHLRIMASIFGKTMPSRCTAWENCQVLVSAQ